MNRECRLILRYLGRNPHYRNLILSCNCIGDSEDVKQGLVKSIQDYISQEINELKKNIMTMVQENHARITDGQQEMRKVINQELNQAKAQQSQLQSQIDEINAKLDGVKDDFGQEISQLSSTIKKEIGSIRNIFESRWAPQQ